jgi:hypothetical protein
MGRFWPVAARGDAVRAMSPFSKYRRYGGGGPADCRSVDAAMTDYHLERRGSRTARGYVGLDGRPYHPSGRGFPARGRENHHQHDSLTPSGEGVDWYRSREQKVFWAYRRSMLPGQLLASSQNRMNARLRPIRYTAEQWRTDAPFFGNFARDHHPGDCQIYQGGLRLRIAKAVSFNLAFRRQFEIPAAAFLWRACHCCHSELFFL